MNDTIFALVLQHITYHTYAGSSKRKEETVLITENQSDGCLQAQNILYKINLEVPPIPPTDDTTSNICKVRYAVRVCLEFVSNITKSMTVIITSLLLQLIGIWFSCVLSQWSDSQHADRNWIGANIGHSTARRKRSDVQHGNHKPT